MRHILYLVLSLAFFTPISFFFCCDDCRDYCDCCNCCNSLEITKEEENVTAQIM